MQKKAILEFEKSSICLEGPGSNLNHPMMKLARRSNPNEMASTFFVNFAMPRTIEDELEREGRKQM